MRRNENGDWTTDDQRFEVKSNGHGRWVLTAKDEDAEAALRSTAHLRPYGRLGDAENWIFAAVYPHLRGEPLNADAAKLQMKMRYASLLYAEFSASESCGATPTRSVRRGEQHEGLRRTHDGR